MALDDLEILVRVVDAGSLSAAGRALGFTPAMVSKRIARLEQRLGAGLLQRTTRELAPPSPGRAPPARPRAMLPPAQHHKATCHGTSPLASYGSKESARGSERTYAQRTAAN